MRELETGTMNLTRNQTQDLLTTSQTRLPSEPPDSLMAEENRIVLIPKLA